MPPSLHAVLGASSAHRWLVCTPSARLCERLDGRLGSRTSKYAEEGTKAHALGELKIRYALWKADGMTMTKLGQLSPADKAAYEGINVNRYKALRKDLVETSGEIPEDMEKATDTYCDVVIERYLRAKEADPSTQLFLEQQLDYSGWAPQGFGTGDALIVSDSLLDVMDYKHGLGVKVDAEGNQQMQLYALGAFARYGSLYDFQNIRCTIIQPRLNSLSEQYITLDALLQWASETVVPAAQLAWEGKGTFVPGEHCRFCSAKAVCAARVAEALKIFNYGLAGSGELSDEQITAILPALDAAEAWIKDIREYTENCAVQGQKFSGYKLVRGKKPNRKWGDEAEVRAQLLRNGYGAEQFEETKLKAVGEIEKAIGKKAFRALLGELVTQGEGRLQLVPEDDPRPEYNSADAAFDDLTNSTANADT